MNKAFKTWAVMGLLAVLVSTLGACASWHISDSKPDKRYIAKWGEEVFYSLLAPEGQWRVFEVVAKTRAHYSFAAHLNPYTYYDISTSMHRITKPEEIARAKKIIETQSYQKDVDEELNSAQFKKNIEIAGDKNVYGKVIELADLKCSDIGWDNHIGPSPDSKNPEFAGLGFYKKESYIYCLVRKGEEYRAFAVHAFFNISDKHLKAEDRHQHLLSPNLIDRDFRWRMERSFNSLDFYGFSQE